jgi:hypothetical protein
MNKNEFFEAIALAWEVDSELINMELEIEGLPEWDSLGQLTMLSQLDDMTSGQAAEIPNIGTMEKLADIWDALVEAGLAKND